MPDFNLVAPDVSPLWKLSESLKQDEVVKREQERRDRIDKMNAETQMLQNENLRMQMQKMANDPRQAKLAQHLLTTNVRLTSALEPILEAESGGLVADGPATAEFARMLEGASELFGGTEFESAYNDLKPLVRAGQWERVGNEMKAVMSEMGMLKQFVDEKSAWDELAFAKTPAAQGKLGNPIHYQGENGNWLAAFDTEEGFVNSERQPITIPGDSPVLESMTFAAATPDDLDIGSRDKILGSFSTAKTFNQTALDVINILNQPGLNDVNTVVGRLAGVSNNLRAEARAVGELFGTKPAGDVPLDDFLDPGRFSSEFREMGIQNSVLQSTFVSLAYQAASASGQEGRSISDKDIQLFFKEVGKDASDPQTLKRTLLETSRRVNRRVTNNAEFRGVELTSDLGFGMLESAVNGNSGQSESQSIDFQSLAPEQLLNLDPSTMSLEQLTEYERILKGL